MKTSSIGCLVAILISVGCGSAPTSNVVAPVTVRPASAGDLSVAPAPKPSAFDPLVHMPSDAIVFGQVDGALFRRAHHVQRIVSFMKDATKDPVKQEELANLESIFNNIQNIWFGFSTRPDDMSLVVEGPFDIASLTRFWKFVEPSLKVSSTPNGMTRFEVGAQTVQQLDESHWLLLKTRNVARLTGASRPANFGQLQPISDGISAVRGWMIPSSDQFKKMMKDLKLTDEDLKEVVIWDIRLNLSNAQDTASAKPRFDFRFEMPSESAAVALTEKMTQLQSTPPMMGSGTPSYSTEGTAAILSMELASEEAEQVALMLAMGMASEMGFSKGLSLH